MFASVIDGGLASKRAIETVKILVKELKKIDDDIYIDWTTKKYEKYPFYH